MNRPLPSALRENCPKAIPVARSSIMLRRLPQAALCRSSRPGLRNFCRTAIKSHPFDDLWGKGRALYHQDSCTANANQDIVSH